MNSFLTGRNTLYFVGILTLWRLYLSATLQLHPDEAYYWLWSRQLDIGYFDHAPLIAGFIRLTTLFSHAELWVRLSGTLVTLLASYFTWQLALQLYGNARIAAGSVMLFNVFPYAMLGLIVITPDIPLYLFWASSLYIFWKIMQTKKVWLWYVLGFSFGLALLSKYTAILLIPSLYAYLFLTEDQYWLKTPHPYLAVLTGLICFSPVVYWNSQHEWVSFSFQIQHGLSGIDYSIYRAMEYTVSQLLVAGPLIWLLGTYAASSALLSKNKSRVFLAVTSIPIIGFFGLTSIHKLAGPNWPVFAYFTFAILVTHYFLGDNSKLKQSLWGIALLISLSISVLLTLHARFSILPLGRISQQLAIADTTNWFYGWKELGAELARYPDTRFAITPSHQLSAEIIYYTQGNIQAQTGQSARPSQFNLWHRGLLAHEKRGFYIWADEDTAAQYDQYLKPHGKAATLNIYRNGVAVRSYRIVTGNNISASNHHAVSPIFFGPIQRTVGTL